MKLLDKIDDFVDKLEALAHKIRLGKILTVLLFLIFLKGCFGIFYWKMTHLSDDDLEWWNASKRYPSATFESDSGNIAYMLIWEKYKQNDSNPFYWEISSAGTDTYEAYAGYHIKIRRDSDEITGFFSVSRSLDTDSLEFDSNLGGFYTARECGVYSHKKQVEVNGRAFDNCLVVDTIIGTTYDETKGKPRKKGIPVKYIFSKEYGLIYYELDDGEKFYRKFPNPL